MYSTGQMGDSRALPEKKWNESGSLHFVKKLGAG